MQAKLDQLLDATPGEGVEVLQDETEVRVIIRASTPPRWGCFGFVAFCVALIPMMVFCQFLFVGPQRPAWWVIALIGVPTLALFGISWTFGFLLILPRGLGLSFRLRGDEFVLDQTNSDIIVPRHDIQRVLLLRRSKPDYKLKPIYGWPWAKSDAAGIALETDVGRIEFLDHWHDCVTTWVADVIATWAEVEIDGNDPAEKIAATHSSPGGGIPQKVRRRQLTQLGCVILLVSAMFAFMTGSLVRDSFDAKEWLSTEGKVESKNLIKRREGKPRLRVTYSYTINGTQYSNDRYAIDDSYSRDREAAKEQLAIGEPVTVWYDPAEPDRAVVDRSFATGAFVMFLVSAIIGCAGIGCLLYARFKQDSEAALKYDPASGFESFKEEEQRRRNNR
ncbi:MAG: DUF3592 domain-containing protein [Planctomycetaceae bacterium]|nr:DUF3592 domain-containing protein [Planctomycetaceae bacterium]